MSTTLSEVNSALNIIHDAVQKSGLHFIINQTPWSSYITIRKKFTNLGPYEGDDNLKDKETNSVKDELNEYTKQMEEKNAKTVANLYSKIEKLENALEETGCDMKNKMTEIQVLTKEKKMKDEIIKNLNAGLLNKSVERDLKVEELENFKKETLKSEKKAIKKLRQKSEKEAVRNNIEPDVKAATKANDNFPDTDAHPANVLAETKPSLLSFSSPVRQFSPVRRPPCNPSSPHTPPRIPQQTNGSLSGYFVDSASSMLQTELQDLVEPRKEPKISNDYINNISKINLVPRLGRN